MLKLIILSLLLGQSIPEQIEQITVGVDYGASHGTGVLIVKEIGKEKVAFVLTAGHVIEDAKILNINIDKKGNKQSTSTFNNMDITQKRVHDDKITTIKAAVKVLKYANRNDEDLAVLMVKSNNLFNESAKFPKKCNPRIGDEIFHFGAWGEGTGYLTRGMVSQKRIMIDNHQFPFMLTTCTIRKGSSGGGIFDAKTGEYLGMTVRAMPDMHDSNKQITGHFSLITPFPRIQNWLTKNDLGFLLDSNIPPPNDFNSIIPEIVKEEEMNPLLQFLLPPPPSSGKTKTI